MEIHRPPKLQMCPCTCAYDSSLMQSSHASCKNRMCQDDRRPASCVSVMLHVVMLLFLTCTECCRIFTWNCNMHRSLSWPRWLLFPMPYHAILPFLLCSLPLFHLTLSDLLLLTNPAPSDHLMAFSRAQRSPGRPKKAQQNAFKRGAAARGPPGAPPF